jgi:hypothetical protein
MNDVFSNFGASKAIGISDEMRPDFVKNGSPVQIL